MSLTLMPDGLGWEIGLELSQSLLTCGNIDLSIEHAPSYAAWRRLTTLLNVREVNERNRSPVKP